jgi:hypothetical protein
VPAHTCTVIVCAAPDQQLDWFTASEILDTLDLPPGSPCLRYPVRRRRIAGWVSRWSAHHLIHAARRYGAVTWTAGGRKTRLDLTLAAGYAHRSAVTHWRLWHQAVKGTPSAQPWPYFLTKHLSEPNKVTFDEAVHRFEAQPRVLAMLAYNSHPARPVTLDPRDLETYQAGEHTYTALHWQLALTGDLLVTADRQLLQPASTSLPDRLRYLSHAAAYLHHLPGRGRLLAIRVTAP